MNTITPINEKILALLRQVEAEHPELPEFLNEMPVTLPDQERPVIDNDSLQSFYQSLQVLVETYTVTHPR